MADVWFVIVDGRSEGPFNLEAMRSRVTDGSLLRESKVCRAGTEQWSWAEADPDLARLFQTRASEVPHAALSEGSRSGMWSFGTGWSHAATLRREQRGTLILLGLSISLSAFILSHLSEIVDESLMNRVGGERAGTLESWTAILLFDVGLLGLVAPIFAAAPSVVADRLLGWPAIVTTLRGFRRFLPVVSLGLVIWGGWLFALFNTLILGEFVVAMIQIDAAGADPSGLVIGVRCVMLVLALVVARVFFPFIFAPTIACDPAFAAASWIDCLRISRASLRGRVWSVLLFLVVVRFIALLTLLAVGIGYVLWGAPMILAARGAAYDLCVRPRAGPLSIPAPSPGA